MASRELDPIAKRNYAVLIQEALQEDHGSQLAAVFVAMARSGGDSKAIAKGVIASSDPQVADAMVQDCIINGI